MERPSYLLPSSAVRARYGISSMTIWRWLKNESLNFPKPVVINKRNYWKLAQLDA